MSLVHIPWIEKYRPNNWEEMIDHQEKIATLRQAIANQELPHLLFHGAPGSGKTSMILATAREMFGANYRLHILELNASDHRGIEIVRTKIPEFTQVRSNHIRLVILDEVDAMTADAQRALRRVMDNNIKNTRFCLICNNITRIIPGIQSRCVRMRFGTLQAGEIKRRLAMILNVEKVHITPAAIDLLVDLNGDFRQILNTLQCLHQIRRGAGGEEYVPLCEADIYHYLGKPSQAVVEEIYGLMFKDFTGAYQRLREMFRRNEWNLIDLLESLTTKVISDEQLPSGERCRILQSLSEIEYRIVNGRDSDIQLASLIASFKGS